MKKDIQEDLLLYKIAEMYYVMEYNLAEIAASIGVTSMTVSRLLKKAKEKGIIQINIRTPYEASREEEIKLKGKFKLKNAVVVKPTGMDVKQQIYKAAGVTFDLLIKSGITVGIGGGNTPANTIEHLTERVAPGLQVIQLVGGLGSTGYHNAYDVLQKFSQKLGAAGTYFPAPLYVRDISSRDSLLKEVFESTGLIKKVKECSLVLSGVGTADPNHIYVKSGLIRAEEMNEIKEAGGVGDIFGQYFDEQGKLINHPINRRVMAVPIEKLRKIKEFVLVGQGAAKIKAALRIGIVTTLVTDYRTAVELIDG